MRAAGMGEDASELHGSLCGYLCAGGRMTTRDWIERLELDVDRPPPAGGALDTLRQAAVAQLNGDDFRLELLLPADDEPLAVRAEAAFEWCSGFLGGFGLADVEDGRMTEDVEIALGEIARIASTDPECEDTAAGEQAFVEIVDFVVATAQVVLQDCTDDQPMGSVHGSVH